MKQSIMAMNRLGALKGVMQRFAVVALVGAAFALMLLGKADTVAVERLRTTVADGVAPVLDVISRPAGSVADGVEYVRGLMHLYEENARLTAENARLLRWQMVARQLEAENDALKALLNYAPAPQASYITGRVVADTGGAFAHSLLMLAGRSDGLRKGQAVMTGEGLVGRVAEVGARASRVLLLTDINSRVPVMVGEGRQRAILAGENTDRPRLIYLPANAGVAPGDLVTTSGVAGAFPTGLPVGVVASVEDGVVRVAPYVQRDRLEMVRALDYGLDGILTGAALD
ncbi:rod shape-determining protein MreC [Caenispirillum salinarum]|uniref:rod shape-determining protein MreC n=1 Tax=Caenispirillum salinarum TaxID=859058 RepID=UPI00384B3A6F